MEHILHKLQAGEYYFHIGENLGYSARASSLYDSLDQVTVEAIQTRITFALVNRETEFKSYDKDGNIIERISNIKPSPYNDSYDITYSNMGLLNGDKTLNVSKQELIYLITIFELSTLGIMDNINVSLRDEIRFKELFSKYTSTLDPNTRVNVVCLDEGVYDIIQDSLKVVNGYSELTIELLEDEIPCIVMGDLKQLSSKGNFVFNLRKGNRVIPYRCVNIGFEHEGDEELVLFIEEALPYQVNLGGY